MNSGPKIRINKREIGSNEPVYIIAELSANHNGVFDQAVKLIHAAKQGGADAVKLQTYTADTMTISSPAKYFRISGGTLWDGKMLYDLYQQAYTPWKWHPKLKQIADDLGMEFFSTAFDSTAVDFLESLGVPVHKVASAEIVDLMLIKKMAGTGKPLIISTGMSTMTEIEEAISVAKMSGAEQIALLKCSSAYPAPPESMNLSAIPSFAKRFGMPIGLSDHTLGVSAAVGAVALGACIIEKHLTLSRSIDTPDRDFSMEPDEFKLMVEAIRFTEKSIGVVDYKLTDEEARSRRFRRSLFVTSDMRKGEIFSEENVRSIRPADGLPPKHLPQILGKRAVCDIQRGTPLSWDLIERQEDEQEK